VRRHLKLSSEVESSDVADVNDVSFKARVRAGPSK
jgi:hypothetical protein